MSATLEPAQISQGQQSMLRVSIAGASRAKVTLPEVPGLQFTYSGQSTSIQFVNMTRSDTVTYAYRVGGFEPGDYTIPAIRIEAGNETRETAPLSLSVLKAAGHNLSPEETEREESEEDSLKVEPEQSNQPYFIQMEIKDEKLYVGQVIPMTYRLFVRAGFDFVQKSLPMISGESFTLGDMNNDPQRYQVSIGGVAYYMLVWNTSLTAIKAGDFDLSGLLRAEVVDRSKVLGGGSSLFDQFIARATLMPVELKTPVRKMKVLPLPQEGRPASFSGAIGDFTFVADVAQRELTSGDPLELVATIEGSGNFDRIEWAGLAPSRLWRAYPPTANFKPLDTAKLEGKKTYKQALIPLSSEIKELPTLEFSYFDPVKGQYRTLRSDPVALKVLPSAGGTASSVPGPTEARGADGVEDSFGLLPNRLTLGSTGQALTSPLNQSWFRVLLILPLLILAGALAYGALPLIKNLLGGGSKAKELDRLLSLEVQAMNSALQQSDSAGFALRARRVLQQVLAREWNCPPEAVTRHEVRQRQPQGAVELEALFSGLDAVDYSGAALGVDEMQRIAGEIQTWLQVRRTGGSRV